jgi:hypothetical protein
VCSKVVTGPGYTIDSFSGYFNDVGVGYRISAYADAGTIPGEFIAGSVQLVSKGPTSAVSGAVEVRGSASVPANGVMWMCLTCTDNNTIPQFRVEPNAGDAGPDLRFGRIIDTAIGYFPDSISSCVNARDCEQNYSPTFGWLALQACSDGAVLGV